MRHRRLFLLAVTTVFEPILAGVTVHDHQTRELQQDEGRTAHDESIRRGNYPIFSETENSSDALDDREDHLHLDDLTIHLDSDLTDALQRNLRVSNWASQYSTWSSGNHGHQTSSWSAYQKKPTTKYNSRGKKSGGSDGKMNTNNKKGKKKGSVHHYRIGTSRSIDVWDDYEEETVSDEDSDDSGHTGWHPPLEWATVSEDEEEDDDEDEEKKEEKPNPWIPDFFKGKTPKSGKKGKKSNGGKKVSQSGGTTQTSKGKKSKKQASDAGLAWGVDNEKGTPHNIFRHRKPIPKGEEVGGPSMAPSAASGVYQTMIPSATATPTETPVPAVEFPEFPEDFGESGLSFPSAMPSQTPQPTITAVPTFSPSISLGPTITDSPTLTPGSPTPRPTPSSTPKPTRPPSSATPKPTRAPSSGTPKPTRAPSSATPKPTPRPTPRPSPRPSPDAVLTAEPTGGDATFAPTVDCLTGTTREDFLLDLLSAITPEEELLDITTPQGQAFDWFVNTDNETDVCTYPTIEQRYSLVTIYFATNGPSWTNSAGWLTSAHECGWFGIECDELLLVIRILLRQNGLLGALPDEISVLVDTRRIDFFDNALTSTIPQGLGSLIGLRVLDLEFNQLTGELFSSEILGLVQLQSLRCSENDFADIIPAEIAQLSALRELWVGGSDNITGTLPTEIGVLTELQTFLLFNNSLSGSLPSELGNLASLSDLRLNGNDFSMGIPIELYGLAALERLQLFQNFLTMSIATEIGNLAQLTHLRFNENFLSGTVPSEVGLLTNLEFFLTNNNFLSGVLPDVFGGMTSLDFFDVSNCQHSGTIPASVFDIDTIRLVYMANNSFTGTIPDNYSVPPLLRDLYLENNMLNGTVPEIDADEFLFLTEFLVQGNMFTGSMPASICTLRDGLSGILDDLWADCGGLNPEIQCDFPDCCTMCFSDDSTR